MLSVWRLGWLCAGLVTALFAVQWSVCHHRTLFFFSHTHLSLHVFLQFIAFLLKKKNSEHPAEKKKEVKKERQKKKEKNIKRTKERERESERKKERERERERSVGIWM